MKGLRNSSFGPLYDTFKDTTSTNFQEIFEEISNPKFQQKSYNYDIAKAMVSDVYIECTKQLYEDTINDKVTTLMKTFNIIPKHKRIVEEYVRMIISSVIDFHKKYRGEKLYNPEQSYMIFLNELKKTIKKVASFAKDKQIEQYYKEAVKKKIIGKEFQMKDGRLKSNTIARFKQFLYDVTYEIVFNELAVKILEFKTNVNKYNKSGIFTRILTKTLTNEIKNPVIEEFINLSYIDPQLYYDAVFDGFTEEFILEIAEKNLRAQQQNKKINIRKKLNTFDHTPIQDNIKTIEKNVYVNGITSIVGNIIPNDIVEEFYSAWYTGKPFEYDELCDLCDDYITLLGNKFVHLIEHLDDKGIILNETNYNEKLPTNKITLGGISVSFSSDENRKQDIFDKKVEADVDSVMSFIETKFGFNNEVCSKELFLSQLIYLKDNHYDFYQNFCSKLFKGINLLNRDYVRYAHLGIKKLYITRSFRFVVTKAGVLCIGSHNFVDNQIEKYINKNS